MSGKNLTHEDIERVLCNAKDEINVIVGVTDYLVRCLPDDISDNEACLLALAAMGLLKVLVDIILQGNPRLANLIKNLITRLEDLVIDACE